MRKICLIAAACLAMAAASTSFATAADIGVTKDNASMLLPDVTLPGSTQAVVGGDEPAFAASVCGFGKVCAASDGSNILVKNKAKAHKAKPKVSALVYPTTNYHFRS